MARVAFRKYAVFMVKELQMAEMYGIGLQSFISGETLLEFDVQGPRATLVSYRVIGTTGNERERKDFRKDQKHNSTQKTRDKHLLQFKRAWQQFDQDNRRTYLLILKSVENKPRQSTRELVKMLNISQSTLCRHLKIKIGKVSKLGAGVPHTRSKESQ